MEVERGQEIWQKIKEKYSLTEWDALVIDDGSNIELSLAAERNLISCLRTKYIRRAVYLGLTEIHINPQGHENESLEIFQMVLQAADLYALLRFYRLIQFTKNIFVISGKAPYSGVGVIGKAGLTYEDYLRNGIFI